MTAEERVALIIGKAIMRAEALAAEKEILLAKIRELEEAREAVRDDS